ncbi:hypothetical protein K439DRAFT_23389 [Ramaria rubella]|nr:hypothetical protein K439DRAFT_23389 [Ramaria rubella]
MSARTSPRRHRPFTAPKRLRLSADTTSSLPAYSSPPLPTSAPPIAVWQHPEPPHPLDEPPDYPQSAEEADQEDNFVPLPAPRPAPSRRLRHRRADSYSVPTSPSVDDLLERSVVALELSTNALLQSMDTQSSISALANDEILERSLDRQTRMLDLRLRGNRHRHEGWMDDLDDVMNRVNGLFPEETATDAGISRSLPTATSHIPRQRIRAPPLPKSRSESAYLHLSNSELDLRDTLVPPRALTQYVVVESTSGDASEATADPGSIYLPSTTGLRSAAQVQSFQETTPRLHGLRKSVSSPGPAFRTAPTTPAYNMLSHLALQKPSRSPSRTATPPACQSSPSMSDSTTIRTPRRHSAGSMDSTFTFPHTRSNSRGRSSASNDTPPLPPVRAMTPPMEEITPSSSESSSSDHRVKAVRAMQSLRKILDEAPDPKGKRPAAPARSPRPMFQPRTPAVAPSSGTSTATASVSRLFTRSSHHTSSSHRSRPKQSSLKQPSSIPSTPTMLNTSGNLISGTLTPASRLSSAPSTPRQVSFANLPDEHSGRSWRKGKGKGKGRNKRGKEHDEGGWLKGWFTVASGSSTVRDEERVEDKMMRGWGRPGIGGSGGVDEWML